jgi:hypothetical protein
MDVIAWLCLPAALGFFAMWRVAEFDLKNYKTMYGEIHKKHNRLRKQFEKQKNKLNQ